ncbi:MAG: TatD DNase family protein [Oleiphilaceae bacterium]|jgi:TatD DNase family protein
MPFADTHCHLDFSQFDRSRDLLLASCQEAAIDLIVVPATVSSGWDKIVALCRRYQQLRPALGLHPYFIAAHKDVHLAELDQYLARYSTSVVAVGEIGLDAFVDDISRQQYFFESQLYLASKYRLPVILHSRKTHSHLMKCLKKGCFFGGVVHAFSGSKQELEQFVTFGLKIGVGGVITWPNSTKTRKAIQYAPLDSLVLETDSPDMPVVGEAKGQSTPLNVLRVFESLCGLRRESPEELSVALWRNSLALYGCDDVTI